MFLDYLCAVRLDLLLAARRFVRRVLLRGGVPLSSTRALRLTLFQIFRAEAATLRARFASRLASFTRLRARLSSSFAMRTRCLATSACSLARSTGSAGACSASADESDAGDASALPVFFIYCPKLQAVACSLTYAARRCHRA